ncbi:cytochrome P450 4C1-like [Belonocnema kinseyi]|uniref:cytochrome P450 4C1-like n=1 Tax=Belonocnema kinseyi TaxID=2817044 RepID=UPI00143D9793|nr:cytochrome P450 4C1-like [Belonocnema kinseyi]
MAVILYFFIGILSIIVLLLFDYVKNIQFYRHAAKIPGPKAYPIVGNGLSFIGKDTSAAYYAALDIIERYASPSRVWFGNQLFVSISEPDQLKTILTSPKSMEKPVVYEFARPWFGNSLILAPAPIWRAHRKLILPAFNPQTLRTFLHIFDKHAKSMTEKMEKELGEGEFKIHTYMVSYSLDVALEGAMGISESSDSKMYTHYSECVNRAFELMMKRAYRPWLHPDIIFNLTKMSKDFYNCINWMHSTAHSIIEKKKINLEKPNRVEKATDEFSGEISNQRKGFLDLLLDLKDKQKFSEQDICDEVNSMIVAAYDTVAVTLQYLMLALASYPDVQEKSYQELKDIYGEVIPEKFSITIEDLKQMKYTERVIQESMRLLPAAPLLLRKVEEELEIGGYTLPKGTKASCCIGRIHRDEKYWPDPLKFDPDRFLPEEVAKRNPYCYLPFSGGTRNCIGSAYGMMEMKTAVARILLKYIIKKKHIQPIANIKQRVEVIAHPVEPITIEIVERIPNAHNGEFSDDSSNQRKLFLDILLDLQEKQKISDQDICDEVNLMIVAAYDTVAVTLQYIMLVLSSYPDVQEKLYQELNQIYGDVILENISVTSEDLKQMKYTERVIQESMRLFPTAPLVFRKVEEDIEIDPSFSGGCTLPKGSTAFCFISKVHRDEKYWPDPLKFDPDRFLPEEVAKRNPNCYMPFSSGPRNCIGSVYAMMMMKTVLTRILLKYIVKKQYIQPIINLKQRVDVLSHPVDPIMIQIVKRIPNTSNS